MIAIDGLPDMQGEAGFVGTRFGSARLRWVYGAIAVIALGFFLRVFWLQVIQAQEYRALAEGNRLRMQPLFAKRGLIVDAYGVVLAENVPDFTLTVVPGDLPRDLGERQALLVRLEEATGVSAVVIANELAEHKPDALYPVPLPLSLTHEQAIRLITLFSDTPGIAVDVGMQRFYPHTATLPSLSHVLGYEGKVSAAEFAAAPSGTYLRVDRVGKAGLEKSYDAQLRGVHGKKLTEVEATGDAQRLVGSYEKRDGATLRLNLDFALQQEAERALRASMQRAGVKRGAVVVENPQNGAVLALVSLPAYDANIFTRGISAGAYRQLLEDPDNPLFPRAVSGEFPSGSTIKIIFAAEALARGLITQNFTVLSTGGLRLGQWFFPDWKAGGHGVTNVIKAIAESVNTFFYTIGGGNDGFIGLGIDGLRDAAERFGISQQLGIDLPGEARGFYPSPEWKQQTRGEKWYVGDTYNVSIGQGDVLVTPLQVAGYTAAIANGGTLYAPRVVAALEQPDGTVERLPAVVVRDNVETPESLAIVRSAMRATVTSSSGSARSLQIIPIPVAGKTGTAQFSSTKDPHAWFTAFAPFDHPEIVVTVLVEEGKEGSAAATPVAREILQWWAQNRYQKE